MGKLVLEKAWDWNDQALMYFDAQRPVMTNFPFFWYHIHEREVRLIKQISKTCGVIFAENKWIEIDERSTVEKMDKRNAFYEVDSETATELERRSWMSLGEEINLEETPKQVTIVHPNGGGCIYQFHPVHGRMLQATWISQDGEIIYKAMYVYNDKNFAVKYGNTEGDKWAKNWNKEKEKYLWQKL
jgi:hypothetical protein